MQGVQPLRSDCSILAVRLFNLSGQGVQFFAEYSDIEELNEKQLEEYLADLEDRLGELEDNEPDDAGSDEYDEWEEKYSEVEDLIDEVEERLQELRGQLWLLLY